MTSPDLPPDVVSRICHHMDDDHAEAALLIAQRLGGAPDATAVRTTGVDLSGLELTVTTPAGERVVVVPFDPPAPDAGGVRGAVVALAGRAAQTA